MNKLYERCCEPKETNRQIGFLFKRWVHGGSLGTPILDIQSFSNSTTNAILNASDSKMINWAINNVNYQKNKELDFVARFNGKYVIGEAKFLTDFSGHQNAQFNDAISTIIDNKIKAITGCYS